MFHQLPISSHNSSYYPQSTFLPCSLSCTFKGLLCLPISKSTYSKQFSAAFLSPSLPSYGRKIHQFIPLVSLAGNPLVSTIPHLPQEFAKSSLFYNTYKCILFPPIVITNPLVHTLVILTQTTTNSIFLAYCSMPHIPQVYCQSSAFSFTGLGTWTHAQASTVPPCQMPAPFLCL